MLFDNGEYQCLQCGCEYTIKTRNNISITDPVMDLKLSKLGIPSGLGIRKDNLVAWDYILALHMSSRNSQVSSIN